MSPERSPIDDLSPSTLAAVEFLRKQLEPAGWELEPSIDEFAHVKIALSHPLTADHVLILPREETQQMRFVESVLDDAEFVSIASRPRAMTRESLVGELRRAAHANRWAANVLAVCARVLRDEAVLSEEEARWLETAGPAWGEVPD